MGIIMADKKFKFRYPHLEKVIKEMQKEGTLHIGDNLNTERLIENAQLAGYRYALADVLQKLRGEF